MEARRHVWVDGSLRDGSWYQKVFERIQERHTSYQIAIFHIVADPTTVFERATRRAEATGRHVPLDEIEDSIKRVPKAVEMLAPK